MMDRLAIEAAEAAVARRPPGRRSGAPGRAGRPGRGGGALVAARARVLRRPRRRRAAHSRRPGAAGRPLAWPQVGIRGRSAGSAPTTTCRTASSPDALPATLRRIDELSREYGLRVANVFHAGDGNLHPLVLYDAAAGEAERAERLATDILAACIEAGGSLSGEHGIGLDKACNMPRMFSEEDMAAMLPAAHRVRPGRPVQPRQGVSDAEAVRGGAGAVPHPSGRTGRGGAAVIDHRPGRSRLHGLGRRSAGRPEPRAGGSRTDARARPAGRRRVDPGPDLRRQPGGPACPPVRRAPRPGAGHARAAE